MKTPTFWYDTTKTPPCLFRLASSLYLWGHRFHCWLKKEHAVSVPVICVGNLVAGGSGKTPTVAALSEILTPLFPTLHVLSKGYGGSEAGPLPVKLTEHFYHEVGDEPLLHAQYNPTWISKNRLKGAQGLAAAGADCIVMDDGFQNPTLKKDLSFVVINGQQGIGNGHILPAGPLREPLETGLKRADAIIFYGQDHHTLKPLLKSFDLPIFDAEIAFDDQTKNDLFEKRVFAFSGLGYPDKFYKMLENSEMDLVGTKSFPDHHPYTAEQIFKLKKQADKIGAQLVTTEKDLMRIPYEARNVVKVIRIKTTFQDPDALSAFVQTHLSA